MAQLMSSLSQRNEQFPVAYRIASCVIIIWPVFQESYRLMDAGSIF